MFLSITEWNNTLNLTGVARTNRKITCRCEKTKKKPTIWYLEDSTWDLKSSQQKTADKRWQQGPQMATFTEMQRWLENRVLFLLAKVLQSAELCRRLHTACKTAQLRWGSVALPCAKCYIPSAKLVSGWEDHRCVCISCDLLPAWLIRVGPTRRPWFAVECSGDKSQCLRVRLF